MKFDYRFFIDKENVFHLVSSESVFCERCHKELEKVFFLLQSWSRKKASTSEVLCNLCLLKVEKTSEVYEAKCGMIDNHVRTGFSPVFFTPPVLQSSSSEVACNFNLLDSPSDRVVDRTRYSGVESFQGAKIGLDPSAVSKDKDKLLSDSQADKFLLELKASKVIVRGDKLLEDKSKGGVL